MRVAAYAMRMRRCCIDGDAHDCDAEDKHPIARPIRASRFFTVEHATISFRHHEEAAMADWKRLTGTTGAPVDVNMNTVAYISPEQHGATIYLPCPTSTASCAA
jgi:hypothetical protein